MLQASDRLASRREPAVEDKSQASKVTFAWKNRNRWERLGPDSKICRCVCSWSVWNNICIGILREGSYSGEVIWIKQAHFHCKYAKELYCLAFGIAGES